MSIRFSIVGLFVLGWCAASGWADAADVQDFEAREYRDPANGPRLPYRLFVPAAYDSGRSYPLLLFLHGGGARGTDNQRQLMGAQTGALVFLSEEQQQTNPCFMLAPQAPETVRGWYERSNQLWGAIEEVRSEYSIDEARIYVSGVSMGGAGSWYLMSQRPDLFAAAIPMSGWAYEGIEIPAHVPVWNFHGVLDETVEVAYSRMIIQLLQQAGGHPIYTEYPQGEHVVWHDAFATAGLPAWLFSQVKGRGSIEGPTVTVDGLPPDAPWVVWEPALELRGEIIEAHGSPTSLRWSVEPAAQSGEATLSGRTYHAASLTLLPGENRITLSVTDDAFTTFSRGFQVTLDESTRPPPPPDASVDVVTPDAGVTTVSAGSEDAGVVEIATDQPPRKCRCSSTPRSRPLDLVLLPLLAAGVLVIRRRQNECTNSAQVQIPMAEA